ncbi:acyl-CoA dehydrogenase family protein [Desertimonas flava]|uniref:acyl-CoA dehydrogenase family protein n=2 Tax=Desertimonas flava TaxID=2064846 RepID=UPI000E347EF3|nr:acyl-CoA dehydrogenase family protein [Desertimonas flava]
MSAAPDLDEFLAEATAFLDEHAERRSSGEHDDEMVWGKGEFDVSVFHALSENDERALLQRAQDWTQTKAERGYHAIDWPTELGGLGLPSAYARAYGRLERGYQTPAGHETHSVTTRLIAPTVRVFGTDEQRADLVPRFLTARELCCQLFSEPGAGSDLAGLSCRAERDGDEWVINGQKVWSSGAQFSRWGELIARHDPDVVKHKGMTAFVIPMDLPGTTIRPIKQMSGGSSFNEVFFDDVRVPDSMRLGDVGDGWKVALTTLGFERDHSDSAGGGGGRVGGSWRQLLATARAVGVNADPVVRQRLARVYADHRIEQFVSRRSADLRRAGQPAGPEGSLGKLLWTNGMNGMSDAISAVLGAALVADTGAWGTYEWGAHVLGAPGYRIAGGSDEVQRNIIGERVLGLPAEPRVDKDAAWRDVPR